jgi:hypothetical protein
MREKAVVFAFLLFGFSMVGFAQEAKEEAIPSAPELAPSAPPAAAVPQETVWLDDALPAGAAAEGSWLWEDVTGASGGKAHAHPSAKGQQSHGIGLAPALLSANGMISQTVWLDPQDPPQGIMLKVKTETGEEAGVYWEGEEEVFVPADEEEVFYYGLLPELGKWVTLEVLAEDLGLEDEKIAQITFVTFDGKALWDKTILTEAPATEEIEFFPDLSPPAPQEEAPLPQDVE